MQTYPTGYAESQRMLDNTQSIIEHFGLASAAPRSPHRHLELCGVTLKHRPPCLGAFAPGQGGLTL